MKVFLDSIKNNRIVLAWFTIFILLLLFANTTKGEAAKSRSLITAVWDYWSSGEFQLLVSALGTTLSAAFPVTIAILFISLFFACLSYFKPITSPYISALMGLSLLPTVYLIFSLKAMIRGLPVDNKIFLVCVLAYSNLILFFFYMSFRKDLHEEFKKEYHTFSKMLGQNSILLSSAKKIGLILMERFRPLFILVFSSTIFAEHKLDVAGGIYSLLYKTTISGVGRPDIFYGQVFFILLFVVLFLVIYDIIAAFIKNRYY